MTKSRTSYPCRTLCVGAVVLKDASVLLVRQTYGELEGKWSIPWGYIDNNETPDQAVLRETLEEGGIIAELDGLLGIQNHRHTNGDLRLYLLFLCRHVDGEPTPDGHETDDVRYFTLDDLMADVDTIDEFCFWLAKRVLNGTMTRIPSKSDNPYTPHLAFF